MGQSYHYGLHRPEGRDAVAAIRSLFRENPGR